LLPCGPHKVKPKKASAQSPTLGRPPDAGYRHQYLPQLWQNRATRSTPSPRVATGRACPARQRRTTCAARVVLTPSARARSLYRHGRGVSSRPARRYRANTFSITVRRWRAGQARGHHGIPAHGGGAFRWAAFVHHQRAARLAQVLVKSLFAFRFGQPVHAPTVLARAAVAHRSHHNATGPANAPSATLTIVTQVTRKPSIHASAHTNASAVANPSTNTNTAFMSPPVIRRSVRGTPHTLLPRCFRP